MRLSNLSNINYNNSKQLQTLVRHIQLIVTVKTSRGECFDVAKHTPALGKINDQELQKFDKYLLRSTKLKNLETVYVG